MTSVFLDSHTQPPSSGDPAGEGGRLRGGLRGPADHGAAAGAVATGGIPSAGPRGDGWGWEILMVAKKSCTLGKGHRNQLVISHVDGRTPP